MKNIIIALLGTILIGCVLFTLPNNSSTAPQFGGLFGSNNLSVATTTKSQAVTSSTRILATTTNATDPSNSYVRVYATICNPNANPVYINMDGDNIARTTDAQVVIAAAAGYNACFEMTDRNQYNGSIQASSTNQTSTTLVISEYVQ